MRKFKLIILRSVDIADRFFVCGGKVYDKNSRYAYRQSLCIFRVAVQRYIKNPSPFQLSLLSLYGRRNRIWLPVSAYFIEHPKGKILIDTGWNRAISPNGEYDRVAQVKHLGVGHFLINQGILPKGESAVEQLEKNRNCAA